jgi:nucleotide-binding universal stress UspA family protein
MDVKKILFPVDLSGFSSNIVQQVISVAEKFGAEIHVVAVVEPPEPSSAHHSSPDRLSCDFREAAEQKLKLFELESFSNYRNIKRALLCGHPAQEILKYISSDEVDLVIMATHRKKGLERAILGSIADEVIRKSPVPVMSINPEERELGWRVSKMSPEQKLRLRPAWEGAKTGMPIEPKH